MPLTITKFVSTDISTPGSDCEHGSVRLGGSEESEVDGEGVSWGRVEVCINGAWGTVCMDLFTQDDADVVCGQLPGFQKEGKQEMSRM